MQKPQREKGSVCLCFALCVHCVVIRKMVLFAMLMIYIWQFMGAFRPQFGPETDQAKVVVMQRGG